MFIGDLNPEARAACAERLRRLGAPVVEIEGDAVEMSAAVVLRLNPYGLNLAFLDPYSLDALDFRIMQTLAPMRRIDMLVHISQMDLQRNLGSNLSEESAFDVFAPGWREVVDVNQSQFPLRQAVFQYWRDQVALLGVDAESEARLIRGGRNQALYWLLIVAKHQLAAQFGTAALNIERQGNLFD
jgi:three-Cys-motif partner protein